MSEARKKTYAGERHKKLVFLDESGVNTDMTRHYARSKKHKRAIDSTPVNTPCSIPSSIRLNRDKADTIYQGGTMAECFVGYLQEKLIPALPKDDIIVVNNMRPPYAKIVKRVLDASGSRYLYLPPYSPGLNPIEKMWSKIKAYLREVKVQTACELPNAIEKAFPTARFWDRFRWFRSCNYMQ